MNVTYIAKELSDTKKLAHALAKLLQKKDLIYLEGELGSGKTTLVQLILANFTTDDVVSPTFSIIQSYNTSIFGDIYHIDLYRVTLAEINNLGLDEIFNFYPCFVEWASKLGQQQQDALTITIKNLSNNCKEFILTFPPSYQHYQPIVTLLQP